jgi:putative transposase
MRYDPFKHQRRSIRLQGYDYTLGGAYFVTICTQDREYLFGEIVDSEMRLSEIGRVVEEEWIKTATVRKNVGLDAFVVMPNHIHGIVVIVDEDKPIDVGAQRRCAPTPLGVAAGSLGAIIRSFKSVVTKRTNQIRDTRSVCVWQRNYHEHIIRDDKDLDRIRLYIVDNPANWETDQENTNCAPMRK